MSIISMYIQEKKGVNVTIIPPYGKEQEEKFIKALNIACAHFKYWIGDG